MDEASDDTEKKHRNLIPFKPGQSGNPKGRPKGARSALGEKFLEDMLADWEENGAAAIAVVRQEKPEQYVKVVASILPRDINIKVNPLEDMADEELISAIDALRGFVSKDVVHSLQ